ncbi:MAG: diaminopimelate epimerase [Acidobacteriota bacterium]|nr:diaminopimelate epimerase [Acidobacteriota bacterium]
MHKVPFQKFHGFGNDYIVVTAGDLAGVSDIGAFTRALCDRNAGAGSDGIAILESLEGSDADYSCRIINSDGSEAGFSGNGTRCAVAFLYREGIWDKPSLRLKTKSGVKKYELLEAAGDLYWYLAELGKPLFEAADIPFLGSDAAGDVEFEDGQVVFEDQAFETCILNVGNPVCAVFVDDFDFEWRLLGVELENHQCFPERTNVVFVKVLNESAVEIRIWERGAGETLSSGTCSIAAAVASAHTARTRREVDVHAEGGTTRAVWRDDGEMLITGSAQYIYSGEWPVGEFDDAK